MLKIREKYRGSVNTMPSKTVAGQSESVRDLIVRYNNGQSVPISKGLRWAEFDGQEDIRINDLTDIDDLKRLSKKLNNEIVEKKAAKEQAAKEQAAKEQAAKEQAAKEDAVSKSQSNNP